MRNVLIAGPTASGKSYLALLLASKHDGIIVNADSMQVYRELPIVTAQPSKKDLLRTPHRLYGTRPAAQAYSVGQWLEDISHILKEAQQMKKPIIITGGTGLYFKLLTTGLSPIPDIPQAIRETWRQYAKNHTTEALYAELQQRDPYTANHLPKSDQQRIIRALEVFEATKRSLIDWQAQSNEPLIAPEATEKIIIAPDRKWLHACISKRFDQMIEQGALDEIRAFNKLELPPSLPVCQAIGRRELTAALSGTLSLQEAIERSKTATRRYAKRQETFFRNQFANWSRLTPEAIESFAQDW